MRYTLCKCYNLSQDVLVIGDRLLNPVVWGDQWKEIEQNRSRGVADLLEDVNNLAVDVVSKMQIGQDKTDDCTPLLSGSDDVGKFRNSI